ncbi:MAG TPA: hypothetical protein VEG38_19970, partial [Acidimicrobiia bacterium]|nr:hypothetical protein [Acidimicrobiia bacterium]
MGEVDRRGFLRMLRRDKEDDAPQEAAAPAPEDPEILQLADLTAALLADLDAAEEEELAAGQVLTGAYDRAYMRVTTGHIVSSFATGMSVHMKTGDVKIFETHPLVENDRGHGPRVTGILGAHHPADLPTVLRSYTFRFPAESPLLTAIRTACDLPEPEPEPEPEAGESDGTDASQTKG